MAILRFENLGPDLAGDWMGRAFSEILTAELSGAPGLYTIKGNRLQTVMTALGSRPVQAPGISTERTAAQAAGATEIVYGQYAVRGGTLEARVTIEDLLTGNMRALDPVSAAAGDILGAATAVAREISSQASGYQTGNPQVVAAYVEGLENLGQPGVAENLQKAIAADPNFAPPYLLLAQSKVQQQDVAGALEVVKQAMARGNGMPERERALVALEDATVRSDTAARLRALTALARSDRYDPDIWRDVAALSMASHQYAQAEEAWRRVVEMAPENGDFWNQLGYAAAWAGDEKTAGDAIERYRKLQPNVLNAVDSLGDVHLIAGNLAEAEKYYGESTQKNPSFLGGLDFVKAAMAHLMRGDGSGADAIAGQFFEARAREKDPLLDYRKAQWAWISGRRKAACGQMEQAGQAAEASGARDLAAHAYAEAAVWSLMLGNRETAQGDARKAIAVATPASAVPATLARFLALPPAAPAEWQARVRQLFPNPAQATLGQMALADALLMAKEFEAARPLLQQMYDGGNPAADEGLPILLGWADLETGHVPEAAALVRANPPLGDTGLSMSTPFYFPRMYYLRAIIAEKQGKADEAKENWRIFRTLSGPDALLWGEESKVK